jgi:hypothetical protein
MPKPEISPYPDLKIEYGFNEKNKEEVPQA